MEWLRIINTVLGAVVTVLYAYQFVFIPLQWLLWNRKKKRLKNAPPQKLTGNRYAVLICARNEANVIGDLIESIREQTYGADKLTIFVAADNCTDDTAQKCRDMGVNVYERNDTEHVGKGYAMDLLMRSIKRDSPDDFDGFFVFDADNLLTKNYIEKMDRKAAEGYDIVTSYRNSKNYGDSWVSSGYATMFMRSSRYLNHTRSLVGTSCYVSGTGYMFTKKIADEFDGWPFMMLTEDIEFSAYEILKGRVVGFCHDAEFFDEQPIKFRQSWRQRLRWSKGYLQVLRHYGARLFKTSLRGNFACYDMNMCIFPAYLVTIFSIIVNISITTYNVIHGHHTIWSALLTAALWFIGMYTPMFLVALVTILTEWKRIHSKWYKKVLAIFTSPIFMLSNVPIAFIALFSKPEWKPIEHSVSAKDLDNRSSSERLPTE